MTYVPSGTKGIECVCVCAQFPITEGQRTLQCGGGGAVAFQIQNFIGEHEAKNHFLRGGTVGGFRTKTTCEEDIFWNNSDNIVFFEIIFKLQIQRQN